jgi:pilus assembly protein CpaF
MPSLVSPGAGGVVPRPRYIHQRDEAFAALQAQAAEAFFASYDPRELPTSYPFSPEDRAQFEGLARDLAMRVGGGPDLADHLLAELVGLGPLEALIDDPTIEEIYANSADQLLYKQEGRVVSAHRAYSHPEFLYLAAQRLLSGRMEEGEPSPVEEVRFADGTRVTLLMPPLAPRGPALLIRKARAAARRLDEMVSAQVLSASMAQLLKQAVEAGRSILIAGPRHSGRVELMSALGALIPEGTRVVLVEDSPGVQLSLSSAVRLETSASPRAQGHDLRYLVRAAMRLQPERVLLNALSGPEAYEWVSAAACGAFGSMAVGHGLSALDALGSLSALCQLAAPELSPSALREQVARAAHLVVVTHRDPSTGAPRVQQIAEVQGVDFHHFRLNDVFYHRAEGGGAFVATGYIPMFYEALRSAGMSVDTSIFNP